MKKLSLVLTATVLTAALCCFTFSGMGGTGDDVQAASASAEHYVGWAVGGPDSGYGAIFRSVDGGANWTRQGSPADIPDVMLEDVAAIGPLNCWVVGERDSGYGTILRTEDGGATWTRQGSPATIPDAGLAKISVLDRNTAWVVGTPGTILFTEDGGRNWAQKQTADIPPILLQGVYALDKDNVWVTGDTYGGYGTIFHTEDGGASWHRKGSAADVSDAALLDVSAVDEDTAWITSRGNPSSPTYSVLYTDDNGATWTGQTLVAFFDTNSVTTIGEHIVWVSTDADGIYRSDNAKDFVQQDSYHGKYSYYLVCIRALDANTAWAAGPASVGPGEAAGIVEHTSDGGKTWVGQLEIDIGLQAVSFTRPSTYYFAEGTTRPGFEPYLCIANPGEAEAIVAIDYMLGDGTQKEQSLAVPPASRATVPASSVLGSADDDAHDFGAVVTCTNGQVIVAERPMYFDYRNSEPDPVSMPSWTGGHCVVGAADPAITWYFAEGYTGPGFEEWICVLNPGDEMAYLTMRFQTQEEGEKTVAGWGVPPHSRISLKVNDILGPDYQCSLALESTRPVVAERSMYFHYDYRAERSFTAQSSPDEHYTGVIIENPRTGGHCVVGAASLSNTFYFAEGSTRFGFDEYLTIQNPGTEPITVDAVYQFAPGQGDNIEASYTVEPGRRHTVSVDIDSGWHKDVSVRLTSDSLFLAERPIYFNYNGFGAGGNVAIHGVEPGWAGGSCVIGATATAREWLFAEGYTGTGFQEWLTLYNPGDADAAVEITYYTQEEGILPARTATVPAGTRLNLRVNDSAGPDYQLSCRVTVVSGPGIVAERPMYFDYGGAWDGGHDVVGLNR
jgi:photosystem II stability/assembly factor-like uncharacterized protein